MWIERLSSDKARSIFGDYWGEIPNMTLEVAAGQPPTRPAVLGHEEYEGALYLYGANGPSVYLFLKSWQSVNRPGGIVAALATEQEIIKVADRMTLPNPTESPRWRSALLEAGYRHSGDTLAHVWYAGMKVGLEIGSHVMRFLAAASAGELAQMPHKDLHFFLDMMPWVRAGQYPCYWDDASDRLVVEWMDSEEVTAGVSTEAYEENLWPTTGIGMRVRDEQAFVSAAKGSGNIILVRDASPAMLQYIGRPGYRPRPPYVPGLTRREPPHVGLIAAVEDQPAPDGFTASEEQDGRLIRDRAGNAFYDGFELVGIYRFEDGKDAYSEAFRRELNCRLGEDLIQGGPYDSLAGVDDPRQPRPPVTAFMPDRAPVRLATKEDMRDFYEAFDIAWNEIYPGGVIEDVSR